MSDNNRGGSSWSQALLPILRSWRPGLGLLSFQPESKDGPSTKTLVCYCSSCVVCYLCISPQHFPVYIITHGQWGRIFVFQGDGRLWMPSCLRQPCFSFSIHSMDSCFLTWRDSIWCVNLLPFSCCIVYVLAH